MFFLDKWQEVWEVIVRNKLRCVLSGLGVFYGIVLLVVMFGASKNLENTISAGLANINTDSCFFWTNKTTIPFHGYGQGRRWYFNN